MQDNALRFRSGTGPGISTTAMRPTTARRFRARPQRNELSPASDSPRYASLASAGAAHNRRILQKAQADRAYFLDNPKK